MITSVTFTRPSMRLWRVKHDCEMGSLWRVGLPEVFPMNTEFTPFNKDWQLLSYALNPGMTGNNWRSLYGSATAFMNGTGFEDEPHADYVNNRDLTASPPKWDKVRVCGGATITGEISRNDLVVQIMNGYGPAPALDWLLARPWLYFHAVNSAGTNGNPKITKFPQGAGSVVLVPLVGSGEARISLDNLQAVSAIADPYYIP